MTIQSTSISTLASQMTEKDRTQTEESDRAAGESALKAGEADEFVYDTEKEWEDAAESGLASANMWKTIGGVVAGGIALATGMAPLAAALVSAGGTFLGGKIGQHQFDQKMKGTASYTDEGGTERKWKAGSTKKLEKGLDQDLMMSTIMSFIMGGTQAGGAGGEVAGKTAEEGVKNLGAEVAKGGAKSATKITSDFIGPEALKSTQTELGRLGNVYLEKAGKDQLSAEAIANIDPTNIEGYLQDTLGLDVKTMHKPELAMWKSKASMYEGATSPDIIAGTSTYKTGGGDQGVFASKTGGKAAKSTYSVSEGYQRNPFFRGMDDPVDQTMGHWWEQAKTNVSAGLFGTGASKWDQGASITSIMSAFDRDDEKGKLIGSN